MKRNRDVKISRDSGFVIQVLYYIFYVLERFSVFWVVRFINSKLFYSKLIKIQAQNDLAAEEKMREAPFTFTYIFPEIWAVGNLIYAVVVANFISAFKGTWVYVILIYSLMRTLELFVYQVNVLFFHRLNKYYMIPTEQENAVNDAKKKHWERLGKKDPTDGVYKIKSATRIVIQLIFNMFEYVGQFAIIFGCLGLIYNKPDMIVGYIGSFELFTNISDIASAKGMPFVNVALAETLIGMFFNIICLARFIGMLPEVEQIDKENSGK